MPRTSRLVALNTPHHITQRGNRRQDVFFCDDDYKLYIALMAEWCDRSGVEIWAYCLMTNHVHLIAVPQTTEALATAIGEAHRRYTIEINKREGWTGHLWQGRFSSFAMDEAYTLLAARYVEMNPVAARMVRKPHNYQWSSAKAHLRGEDDALVTVSPLLDLAPDWQDHLDNTDNVVFANRLEYHSSTGWPLGSDKFLKKLEAVSNRTTKPAPRGRPKKEE